MQDAIGPPWVPERHTRASRCGPIGRLTESCEGTRPMRSGLTANEVLEADLSRLRAERLAVIALDDVADLVRAPTIDPFVVSRSPERAGVEELGATLAAARRLPETLTVRVVLPAGAQVEPPVAVVETALHRRAAALSSVAWREGMAIRSMGLRQLPLGLTVAVVAWVIASVAGSRAADASGWNLVGLALIAIVGITIAWVVSWMVVEYVLIDWRPAGRRAAAYDLLARATLEVVVEAERPGG